MEVHQLRVVNERFDLNEKMDKLSEFLASTTFYNLPPPERGRLVEQLGIMNQYRDVLDRRISAF